MFFESHAAELLASQVSFPLGHCSFLHAAVFVCCILYMSEGVYATYTALQILVYHIYSEKGHLYCIITNIGAHNAIEYEYFHPNRDSK